MKRIGIFSGTFDPIHQGHLEFALETAKNHKLEKVVFLIERQPRHKANVSDYNHRLAMLKLATKDNKRLEILEINQPNFTVKKTLPVIKSKFSGYHLWLLLGSDVAEYLHEWPNTKQLLKEVQIIVGTRGIEKNIQFHEIQTKHNEVSSSKIREALAKGQKPNDLSPEVRHYALKHNLYS